MPATTARPTVTEATDTDCRKCGGSGDFIFFDGRIGDCYSCGGGGKRLRHRPMNDAEFAAYQGRVNDYNAEREGRKAARHERWAQRDAAEQGISIEEARANLAARLAR